MLVRFRNSSAIDLGWDIGMFDNVWCRGKEEWKVEKWSGGKEERLETKGGKEAETRRKDCH